MLGEASDYDTSMAPGKREKERKMDGRSLDHCAVKGRFGKVVQES